MAKCIPDFPSGPLDRYRKSASFDWKKLKIFLETEDIVEYQNTVYQEIQKYPVLFPQSFETPTLDEQRRVSTLRTLTLRDIESLSFINQLENVRRPMAIMTTLFQLDPSATIKHSIAFGMFPSVLQGLGTERHLDYLKKAFMGEVPTVSQKLVMAVMLSACKLPQRIIRILKNSFYTHQTLRQPNVGLVFLECEGSTSLSILLKQGEGSLVAIMWNRPIVEVIKTFIKRQFSGQMATHAIVYAQLITPDGVNRSLHPFIVKIRDPKTYLPYPGVTVGDMGEKIALNGVDNGFVMFNQYRIPRTDLLNRTGDVTEDGKYVTPYRDPNKRYGASLGALSVGRVTITGICSVYAGHALTIAIRYAAVRKQFGPEGDEEIPILEYQTHQHRLIPYLSVAYILKNFASYLMMTQYQFSIDAVTGDNQSQAAELGLELHAISSASKPVAGWVVKDAVQECREACAGHGYLKAAGIGDIKNANDANCTYEGENHVLIQQTSNWLLKFWPLVQQGQKISSPLQSIDFLTNGRQILGLKCNVSTIEEFLNPNNILDMYRWLVCYLLKASYEKNERMKSQNLDSFWAKNESQVFFCRNLGVAYIQHFMIQRMSITIAEATDPQIKQVLFKLLSLYGVWSLEKHIATFYQGGYASGPMFATLVQDSILHLCKALKDDAVALVDVIAPPDFLIKSVLGQSDGQVYKHLEAAMLGAPGALTRPSWWKEIAFWKDNVKSKL